VTETSDPEFSTTPADADALPSAQSAGPPATWSQTARRRLLPSVFVFTPFAALAGVVAAVWGGGCRGPTASSQP
jgi:hypothetical protein